MANLVLRETSVIDIVQEHRKATIRTMLQHGDIDKAWTPATLAEHIGLPEDKLIAYVEDAPGSERWVDSLVARYLSVSIENWRGGA